MNLKSTIYMYILTYTLKALSPPSWGGNGSGHRFSTLPAGILQQVNKIGKDKKSQQINGRDINVEFAPRYNFALITLMISAESVIVSFNRYHVQ